MFYEESSLNTQTLLPTGMRPVEEPIWIGVKQPQGHCIRSLEVLLKGQEWVMSETKVERCAHPGCNCLAAKGSKYCGAYCEGAADHPSIACNCGHMKCAATETVGATG